jgi:uncharacterized protein (DUF2249 family)
MSILVGMKTISTIFLFLVVVTVVAQQVPDTVFLPVIKNPRYAVDKGPVVLVDESHYNFHTTYNRFKPFSNLLRRDGYQVKGGSGKFSSKSFKGVDILVISNALNTINTGNWTLPTPSAFSDDEIAAIHDWVKKGGSLFLIADHMPFPGCNEKLAAAFGFTFYNGFAVDTTRQGPDLFSVANNRLTSNEITNELDSIYTFTGQGFDIPQSAKAILILDQNFKIWSPKTAWKFDTETTKISGDKKVQLAMLEYGKGRILVGGEAAMFTAQLAGGTNRVGFNSPLAKNNAEFLLRLIHWLDQP